MTVCLIVYLLAYLWSEKISKGKHIRLQKLCKYRIRSFDTVNTVIREGDDIEGLYSSTWFDFNIYILTVRYRRTLRKKFKKDKLSPLYGMSMFIADRIPKGLYIKYIYGIFNKKD